MRIVLSAVGAFMLKMLGAALFLVVFLFLFVIVVLCLFLFCPIRYKGEAEYDGDLTAKGRVTWLFSVLSVSFSYQKGVADSRIRILGFDVLKFLEKRQKNDTGREKKSSKAKKKRKKNKGKNEPFKNEPDLQITQIEEDFSEDTILEEEKAEESEQGKTVMPDLEISEVSEKETDQTDLEVSQLQEDDEQIDLKGSKERELEKEKTEESGLGRFFQRIKELLLLPGKKIKGLFRTFRKIIKNVKDKAESLSQLKEFWKSENTQGMVCIFKDNVLHLLRKIKPKVLRGTIFFGTGDPCTTGLILGVAAILYAAYGKGIQVVPDFEEARLEGELYVKGRLSMITLLIIAIKIYRSSEWKQFKYDIDQLKEAL